MMNGFSIARWWGVVRKEFLQLRRDRVTFAMIIGIPIIALLSVLLGWSYGRSIRRGQPLTPTMRKMLLYGFLYVLGSGYSFALASMLGWERIPW